MSGFSVIKSAPRFGQFFCAAFYAVAVWNWIAWLRGRAAPSNLLLTNLDETGVCFLNGDKQGRVLRRPRRNVDAACVLLLTQAATTTQTRGQATHVALICNDAKRRRNGILASVRKLDAENMLSVLIDRGVPKTSTPPELSSSLPLPQPATAASAGVASDPPRGAAAADDDVDLDGTEAAASVGSAEVPLALDLDDVASAQPPVERAEQDAASIAGLCDGCFGAPGGPLARPACRRR
jgi:hypothetical protein